MDDVIRRWEMLTTHLRNQIKGGVAEHILDNTRDRIRRLAADTDRTVVQLPKPDFDDECFKGLRFGLPGRSRISHLVEDAPIDKRLAKRQGAMYLDRIQLPVTADPMEVKKVVMELERLYMNARKRTKEYKLALVAMQLRQARMLQAKEQGKAYNPRRPDRVMIRPNRCWCGCGRMAGMVYHPGGYPIKAFRYVKGHILKYVKMIALVERGFERWEDLPVLLKEGLKWGPCRKCKGTIPLSDPHGQPLTVANQIGIACWRERLHVWWPYRKEPVKKGGKGPSRRCKPGIHPLDSMV